MPKIDLDAECNTLSIVCTPRYLTSAQTLSTWSRLCSRESRRTVSSAHFPLVHAVQAFAMRSIFDVVHCPPDQELAKSLWSSARELYLRTGPYPDPGLPGLTADSVLQKWICYHGCGSLVQDPRQISCEKACEWS
jgi:hypothetical protein